MELVSLVVLQSDFLLVEQQVFVHHHLFDDPFLVHHCQLRSIFHKVSIQEVLCTWQMGLANYKQHIIAFKVNSKENCSFITRCQHFHKKTKAVSERAMEGRTRARTGNIKALNGRIIELRGRNRSLKGRTIAPYEEPGQTGEDYSTGRKDQVTQGKENSTL